MGPIELLHETQRVAGHPKLSQWHEDLIEIGRNKAQLDAKRAEYEDNKKNLDSQMQSMQRDVQRFQERERIENQVRERVASRRRDPRLIPRWGLTDQDSGTGGPVRSLWRGQDQV